MQREFSPALKITFLVHGIMMSVFGLIYLFFPVLWGDLTGCLSNQVPQVFRLFGTAILGYAISSFLAYQEESWDAVKIVALTECVITVLFPIVILLALLFWDLPAIGWMYVVLMSGFAVAFNITYRQ